MRDGVDVEDGIRLAPWNTSVGSAKTGIASYSTGRGQGVIAGVVAERAFVAQRFGRVNAAFDDEVGLPLRSLCEAFAKAGVGQNVRGWKIRVISARTMNKKERAFYELQP